MMRLLALLTIALAVTAADARPVPAAGPTLRTGVSARERCEDLVAFFDRWGATRSGQSDGSRNHTRIAANIECERGRYEAGIARMEALLAAKKFEVPADVGQAPMYFPDEEVAEHSYGRAPSLARRRTPQAREGAKTPGSWALCLPTDEQGFQLTRAPEMRR